MELIESVRELEKNLEIIEYYLTEGTNEENKETIGLIKRGTCFVAYEIDGEIRFAPSKFIGYKNNDVLKHIKVSRNRDGRDTNKLIKELLGFQCDVDNELDSQFIKYCERLGIAPYNKQRKFWKYDLKRDFQTNNFQSNEFPEGKIVERKHKFRERNSEIIKLAKDNFKKKHGRLFCQICKFDFEKQYGEVGIDYIEAHHTIPVSEMGENHKTKVEDIALLCSNCHSMVHRKRPWLMMRELQELFSSKS